MTPSAPVALPEDLTELERLILETCSAIAEPVHATTVLEVLLDSGVMEKQQMDTADTAIEKLRTMMLIDAEHKCADSITEPVARTSYAAGRFARLAAAASRLLPAEPLSEMLSEQPPPLPIRLRRNLRAAVITHDVDAFHHHLLRWFESGAEQKNTHIMVEFCNRPFDGKWLGGLPAPIQIYGLHEIFKHTLLNLEPAESLLEFLREPAAIARIPTAGKPSFMYMLITLLLFRGEFDEAERVIAEGGQSLIPFGLHGALYFFKDRRSEAIPAFEKALGRLKKITNHNDAFFTGPEGLFCMLAWLASSKHSLLCGIDALVSNIEKVQPHNIFIPAYEILRLLANVLNHSLDPAGIRRQRFHLFTNQDSISVLFQALFSFWTEGTLEPATLERAQQWSAVAQTNGYKLLADWYGDILGRLGTKPPDLGQAVTLRSCLGIASLVDLLPCEESWQRALRALNATAGEQSQVFSTEQDSRLSWFIQLDKDGAVRQIIPREQKKRNNGWSFGRNIAIKRLLDGTEKIQFSSQDRRILETISVMKMSWGMTYEFDLEKALSELAGHPLIFLDSAPQQQIELVRGLPELCIEEHDNKLRLFFVPPLAQGTVQMVREASARFRFFPILRAHRQIGGNQNSEAFSLPVTDQEKFLQIIRNISPHVTIHSDILDLAGQDDQVEGSSRIHLLLTPVGEGLRIAMHVRPLEKSGPYLKPGIGQQSIMTKLDEKEAILRRNLDAERENAAAMLAAVPSLLPFETGLYEYVPPSPGDCLQILLELREIQGEVVIEWPHGRKLTVSPQVGFEQLHLSLHSRGNWFEAEGRLEIDENLVLDMKKLLDLVRQTEGRFVPIGPGQFLTLSQELRRRLEEINSLAETGKKHIRLHPLAALSIEGLSWEGVKLETDKAWKDQLLRIREAEALNPQVPSKLKTTLRTYQVEGYQWLARLAHWGVGACLADDMGLGKTVQALAIILERASGGPTLVVAPTSVCMNWIDEAKRFAPALNIIMLGNCDRDQVIQSLKPHDLLVISYSLLQQEEERLTSHCFRTIVLDEAQAIKNMATKRSRAAMNLKGEFRIITTGTPIENNLEELWNLFRFINPGLLGTITQFRERFEAPIRQHDEREGWRRLKKLIQPFILRRLKSEVLEELPPRTEMFLRVEMNKDERAIYEALRRQAEESIKHSTGSPGVKNLHIFREITRLRLACCHPRLVTDSLSITSSKLDIFGKVVEELIENKHRALVFSQFVGFLSLIREYLDERQISYRYLDGSTPAGERRQEVQTFQKGKGDLFLISLRAGGLGLNLTAADYVIHMDPWWNPAVEDQASDRAHRIGQQRPVTVYRLIMQNSIEEKIMKLHQEKRDLADGLLAGTNLTGRLSTEELLSLLGEH